MNVKKVQHLLSQATDEIGSFKVYGMYFALLYLTFVLVPIIIVSAFFADLSMHFGLITAFFASFAGYKMMCDVFLKKQRRVFTKREYITAFRYGYWIALTIQILALLVYLLFGLLFIPLTTLFGVAVFMGVIYVLSAILLYVIARFTFRRNVELMHVKWVKHHQSAQKIEPQVFINLKTAVGHADSV